MNFSEWKVQRDLLFWSLHALGWLGYGLSHYVGSIVFNRPIGYTTVLVIACAWGFIVTAPLRYLCRWLWGRRLIVVVPLCLASIYAVALLWRFGANWAYLEYYRHWILTSWAELFVGSIIYAYPIACWIGFYFIIRYYESVQQQREAVLRATSSAQQAQLTMLRYQLNPHFLFNTLNAVSTLILDHRGAVANSMVNKLADFLRYTLEQDPTRKVTLAQEIESLGLYLDIEKLRFGSRLRMEFAIEPEANKMLLPSLLLQPIVENAVKYAVSPREQGALIRIEATIDRGMLQLQVSDDGPGMLDTTRLTNGLGVGVRNTRERLQVLYGERGRIEIDNTGPGLRIVLCLPAEPATLEVSLRDSNGAPTASERLLPAQATTQQHSP